ncbi:hypothetical protein CVT26_004246 [Gymnopilus dilepis]|uniref:Uncharacterized protein n=1 Tax=Gymnopilus dilepis TaxID=231916 RepID=A0A409W708_9AGAR|nr:hypothetical protein CVT26_004246 [Gymnopilus dilepis]
MPATLTDSQVNLLLHHLSTAPNLTLDLQDLLFDLTQQNSGSSFQVPHSNDFQDFGRSNDEINYVDFPERGAVNDDFLPSSVDPTLLLTDLDRAFAFVPSNTANTNEFAGPSEYEGYQNAFVLQTASDEDFSMGDPSHQVNYGFSDGNDEFDPFNDDARSDISAESDYNVHEVGDDTSLHRHPKRSRPAPYRLESRGSGSRRTGQGEHVYAQGRGKGHKLCVCMVWGGGDGDGGGGGGGGNPPPAHYWHPECRRAGYLARLGMARAMRGADNEADEEQDVNGAGIVDGFAPIAEPQALSDLAMAILRQLANTCRGILKDISSSSKLSEISSRLAGIGRDVGEVNHLFSDNSLPAIISRVELYVESKVAEGAKKNDKARVTSPKKNMSPKKKVTPAQVLRATVLQLPKEQKRSYRTLCRWLSLGTACCVLAGSGSVFMLVIAASSQIKTMMGKLPPDQWVKVGALMRCPAADTTEGQLVIKTIIPAVHKLRGMFDIKVSTMLSSDILQSDDPESDGEGSSDDQLEGSDDQPKELRASDIVATDEFFDKLKVNAFIKPRDWDGAWARLKPQEDSSIPSNPSIPLHVDTDVSQAFLSDSSTFVPCPATMLPVLTPTYPISPPQRCSVPPSSPPSSSPLPLPPSSPLPFSPTNHPVDNGAEATPYSSDMEVDARTEVASRYGEDEIFTIHTKFDPKQNATFEFRNLCVYENYLRTEEVRAIAEHAYVPKDLEEVAEKLQEQLKTGRRTDNMQYVKIVSRHLTSEKIVRIKDVHGKNLVTINATMDIDERNELLLGMKSLYSELTPMDSKAQGVDYKFPCIHNSHYARFSTQLNWDDLTIDPLTIDPAVYRRPGKRKVNSGTFIPRASAEIQQEPEFYDLTVETLEPTLAWQADEFKALEYDAYQRLAEYPTSLPGNAFSPAYPFGGFVVNLNASTRIHRDHNDAEDICVVIVISENCIGGGLVIMELGLVIDLENGDSVIFRSSQLTHLNLHFRGVRASLVFHTDKAGLKSWVGNEITSRGGWAQNKYFRSS